METEIPLRNVVVQDFIDAMTIIKQTGKASEAFYQEQRKKHAQSTRFHDEQSYYDDSEQPSINIFKVKLPKRKSGFRQTQYPIPELVEEEEEEEEEDIVEIFSKDS